MDTMSAFLRGLEARRAGNKMMVFDWDKAARLIVERKPSVASAGLRSDWEWTGGTIWRDGKPDMDSYTFLSSCFAHPELDLDGEIVECLIGGEEAKLKGWDSGTKWPDSALAILRDAGMIA